MIHSSIGGRPGVKMLAPNESLRPWLTRSRRRARRPRRLDRHQRKVVSVDLCFGFLLLSQPFLRKPELFTTALEVLVALCFFRRIHVFRQAFDRNTRITAIRIVARFFRVLITLQQHAVERDAILHEIRDRHRRNTLRTAGGASENRCAHASKNDNRFDFEWHRVVPLQCY